MNTSRSASFALSRRAFLGGSAAFLASTAVSPALAGSVDSFVAGVWRDANSRGVPRRVFDQAMGDFRPLDSVLAASRKQPETTATVGDYVTGRVTAERIRKGRDNRSEWSQTLGKIEQQYGLQDEVVLAIWGMETNFGGYTGNINTPHALATLTYGGYRSSYFRGELLTSLQILAAGHVKPHDMTGSWAGAMGQTQFMPTSFMRYAVDFRGDGKKDIWNSVPDALASSANYLKEHGWQAGETWGYEVKLPRGFDYRQAWTDQKLSVGDWSGRGVARANGRAFPRASDTARLYLPMGGTGPVFLVLKNFDVIKRYNNSNSYALSVGHLADRILGGGDFAAAWPDDRVLDEAGRREVQKLLARKGYEIGSPDGVIGPKTRAAVIDWQAKAGLLPDGYVAGRLLSALRG